jgi:hypothetical protein
MRYLSKLIFLILVISIMTMQGSFSQTEENTEPEETVKPESEDKNNKETSPETKSEISKTFIPSEDISEDLSVAFPVDI